MKGRRWRTVTCDSCDVLVINNIVCHEFGCPNKDEPEEGEFFEPLDAEQREALRLKIEAEDHEPGNAACPCSKCEADEPPYAHQDAGQVREDKADQAEGHRDDLEDDARTAQAGDAFNLSPLHSRPGWTL